MRLTDFLLLEYLRTYHSDAYALMKLLGVIKSPTDSAYYFTFDSDTLLSSFSDPVSAVKTVYNWGNSFDMHGFLDQCRSLGCLVGIPASFTFLDDDTCSALGILDNVRDEIYGIELPIVDYLGAESEQAEFKIVLCTAPAPNDSDVGIIVLPIVIGAVRKDIDIGDGWTFRVDAQNDDQSRYGLIVRPSGLQPWNLVKKELTDSYRLEIILEKKPASGQKWMSLKDNATNFGVEIAKLGFRFLVEMGANSRFEFGLACYGATLSIGTGSNDGFLSRVLPAMGGKVTGDFEMVWSPGQPLHFRNSSTLNIRLPAHLKVGPALFNEMSIDLLPAGSSLQAMLGLSFSIAIGPLHITVSNLGISIESKLALNGTGNLSLIDLQFNLQSPTGVGIEISEQGLSGGGSLVYQKDSRRYLGALELHFNSLSLSAIGVITTDPASFSMLISICAEFVPPIQLGFGFRLEKVGGLVGVHRKISVETLRKGLREHAFDSILFPTDVLHNVDKIIGDLDSAFPRCENQFVIGPMVKIVWGEPVILRADLAILLELPKPLRIVVLGQLSSAFPSEDEALILLHIDVLGVVDFDKRELAIDATLYDSRIVQYPLSGDAALRLNWGDNPQFALSLGGFHPQFTPPIGFPTLRRLSLAIDYGSALQITSQAYLAITSNSLQFGLSAQLHVKAGPATIDGHLGFDTLIYVSPFSFTAEIRVGMAIKVSGRSLAGIKVHLILSGPRPWHAEGKAKIELLFFDVTVSFSLSWGDSTPASLPEVNPLDELEKNLNLDVVLPRDMAVMLRRDIQPLSKNDGVVLVYPSGALAAREKVLPLGVKLDKVNNSPIKDYDQCEIGSIKINDQTYTNLSPTQEYFAVAQFQAMTQDEQLSLPSFILMNGGAVLAAEDCLFVGDDESVELCYESLLVTDQGLISIGNDPSTPRTGMVNWEVAKVQVQGNAAARSSRALRGFGPSDTAPSTSSVIVQELEYALAGRKDLKRDDVPATDIKTRTGLRRWLGKQPELAKSTQVVPGYEYSK